MVPVAGARSAIVLASSSAVIIATFQLLQWRARRRAKSAAERAKKVVEDGPMINCSDHSVRIGVLNAAIRRASKWISYLNPDDAVPMRGQVGGISFGKRPVLTLAPDYVLKPLHVDYRGFREIAFYEAIEMACKSGKRSKDTAMSCAAEQKGESTAPRHANGVLENTDALAMWLAIFLKDRIVEESEQSLVKAWKALRKEIDLLRRISNFTVKYYGVVGQHSIPKEYVEGMQEISPTSYLMLADATINYSKPCVIDLKMGQQSFEPDAIKEKREREIVKYPKQNEFGFRIVGMKVYDPLHPDADASGYRMFRRDFGRSLETHQQVVEAFRTFFHGSDRPLEPSTLRRTKSGSALELDGQESSKAIRTRVITKLLSQLNIITRWFEENRALAFYSSSILMIHEGDTNASSRDMNSLKMIDFGHVRRESRGDPGYLHGLRVLASVLNIFLEEERIRNFSSTNMDGSSRSNSSLSDHCMYQS